MGTLIGKGKYGCVYAPPLQCEYNPVLNQKYGTAEYVSKLTTFDETTDNELAISKQLKNKDPQGKYFVLIETICQPLLTQQIIQQCPIELEEPILLFSKNRGIDIDSYVEKNKADVIWLWHATKRILEGVLIMHNSQILHNDLTSGNTLVDSLGIPRIIDFGAAIYPTDDPGRLIEGIMEYKFHSGHPLFVNAIKTDDPQILYDRYDVSAKEDIPSYERGTASDIILNTFNLVEEPKYVENVIMPNIFKIDVYSLGLSLYRIYIDYIHTQGLSLSKHKNRIIKLFNKMTHIDVNQQFDVKQSLEYMLQYDKEFR